MRFRSFSWEGDVLGVLSLDFTFFCLVFGSSEDFWAGLGAERWGVVEMGEETGERTEDFLRSVGGARRAWRRGNIFLSLVERKRFGRDEFGDKRFVAF